MSVPRPSPTNFYGDRATYEFSCDYTDAGIASVQQQIDQLSTRVNSIVVSGLPDTLDGGTF